jgi:hypothetical protein
MPAATAALAMPVAAVTVAVAAMAVSAVPLSAVPLSAVAVAVTVTVTMSVAAVPAAALHWLPAGVGPLRLGPARRRRPRPGGLRRRRGREGRDRVGVPLRGRAPGLAAASGALRASAAATAPA